MSVKYKKEDFIKKLDIIYPNNKIEIVEWNGYTKLIKYKCDICSQIHSNSDARQLLQTGDYCKNRKNWTFNFSDRLNKLFNKEVEIVEFTGLSNKLVYKCPSCGELKSCAQARILLSKH